MSGCLSLIDEFIIFVLCINKGFIEIKIANTTEFTSLTERRQLTKQTYKIN